MKRYFSIRGTMRTYPGKKEKRRILSKEHIDNYIKVIGDSDPYVDGYNAYWNCDDYECRPQDKEEWEKGWHDAEAEHAQQIKGTR